MTPQELRRLYHPEYRPYTTLFHKDGTKLECISYPWLHNNNIYIKARLHNHPLTTKTYRIFGDDPDLNIKKFSSKNIPANAAGIDNQVNI